MAVQRYRIFFGVGAQGGAPSFPTYKNNATGAVLNPAPVFTDAGDGSYTFGIDWALISATDIYYVACLAGFPDQWDELTSSPAPGVIAPAVRPQNLALFPTAKTVLNRAAVQCGLQSVDDPYASTDQAWVLLRELLVTLGDDIQEDGWTHLVQLASFVTDGVSSSYALPVDYHEIEDNTLWNRTTRLPGIGPLSYQQAAFLQARLANVVFSVTYIIAGGSLVWPIVPPAGSTVAFYYGSSFWVNSAASGTPDKGKPTANDDVLLFDEELLVLGLKLKYLEEKGYDTTKVESRYLAKLEHVLGKNKGGRTLSIVGPSDMDPLIDGDRNMPYTGFGHV